MSLLFPRASSFPACHASTVAELPDGRLLVAFFAGTRERDPDTAIWMVTGDGKRWERPRQVFKINELPHWNPVLFVAPDGTLHSWFKTGPDCKRWVSWHALSKDGGESWSEPQPFQHGDLPRGPVRCPPIIATDGAWLAPSAAGSIPTHRTTHRGPESPPAPGPLRSKDRRPPRLPAA